MPGQMLVYQRLKYELPEGIVHVKTGQETLTNKVLDGKPVYQMLVDCGLVPQGKTAGTLVQKTISVSNISNIDLPWIEASYMFGHSGTYDTVLLPWMPMAGTVTNNSVSKLAAFLKQISDNEITLTTGNTGGTGYNTRTIKILIQYTKTTD